MIEDGVQISCVNLVKARPDISVRLVENHSLSQKILTGCLKSIKNTKEEFQETLPNRSHTNRCFLTAEQSTGRWDMHLKIFFLSGVLYFDNYSNLIYSSMCIQVSAANCRSRVLIVHMFLNGTQGGP